MPQIPRIKVSPQLQTFLIHIGLSMLFGLLCYFILYSHYPLYFSRVNWIYNIGGDPLQHQLGWEWFRQEPWRFPLGSIEPYGYPFGTSVTFLDSIPLFAIFFKLLSPWLEPNFQYFGLWELASVIGQMLLGFLILHEFTRSYPAKILGAALLVFSPPMIFRAFYHNSLSAHWILLAAIWFILLEYRHKLWRGAWIVLFAVATWVQVYFIPMLVPLWLIGMFFHYKREKKRWMLLLDVFAVVAVVFVAGYAIGLFGLDFKSLAASGYGIYSWNGNGFFNPLQYSAYLKDMPAGGGGQYEGFSYLGLGNLLILPAALYIFLQKECLRRRLTFFLPIGAAGVLYTLFALSNKAFLNAQPLWNIRLSDSLLEFLNLFRTSGRFIWPVFYFLVLLGLITIIRNIRYPALVLLLALLIQISDLRPLFELKTVIGFTKYQPGLQMEFWQQVANTNKHITIIPEKKLSNGYERMAIYAVHNNMTLNLGYFARSDARASAEYGEQVWEELKANRPDVDTIYIITDSEWVQYVNNNLADNLLICEIDGYTITFSPENKLAQTDFKFAAFCSVPAP